MTSDRWITFWSKDGAEVRTGLLQHVRDDWETGWRITARVNRRLSETAGLRVMGTSGQVVAMLLELEAEGAVEKRKGPMGFMEWRRADGQARNAAEKPIRCQSGPESARD